MEDGVYRIYALSHGEKLNRRLMGRVALVDGYLHQLEDHFGTLDAALPNGQMTEAATRCLQGMAHSPYYQVVNEEHINDGHHPQDIPDLDVGQMAPESCFMLAGEGLAAPQLVEIWGDAVVVAGRRLSESDLHELMGKVREGLLHLTPVER